LVIEVLENITDEHEEELIKSINEIKEI